MNAYADRHGISYPNRHREPTGQMLVPPGMVFLRPAQTFGILDGPPMARGGIYTATRRWYQSAVRVGETVRFDGELFDKYERRGLFYIAVRWTGSVDGRATGGGEEWHTLGSIRKKIASAVTDSREPSPAVWPVADRTGAGEIVAGEPAIGGLPSGPPSLRRGAEVAGAGLRSGVIVNEFHFAHVTEMLLDIFGGNWRTCGEIELAYRSPLLYGETLSPKALLNGLDLEGRLLFDVWCENDAGHRLAVGRARCSPPSTTAGYQ